MPKEILKNKSLLRFLQDEEGKCKKSGIIKAAVVLGLATALTMPQKIKADSPCGTNCTSDCHNNSNCNCDCHTNTDCHANTGTDCVAGFDCANSKIFNDTSVYIGRHVSADCDCIAGTDCHANTDCHTNY